MGMYSEPSTRVTVCVSVRVRVRMLSTVVSSKFVVEVY